MSFAAVLWPVLAKSFASVLPRKLQKDDMPGRHDRTGGTEFIHSLVSTACVSWVDPSGNERQEDIMLPPRQMTSTSAAHIGSALTSNLETHLLGCTLEEAVHRFAGVYDSVGVHCVGDSAKSNIKAIRELFAYLLQLGRSAGVMVTCSFTACMLHQLMRIVLLLLEHKQLTASLYSITRIHLSSVSRRRTFATVRELLERRFVFHPDSVPPDCPATDPFFRARLKDMLAGAWDGMVEEDDFQRKSGLVDDLLRFFNGNLLDRNQWVHHCSGCHKDKSHAMHEVCGLEVGIFRHCLLVWKVV